MLRSMIVVVAGLCIVATPTDARPKHRQYHLPIHHDAPVAAAYSLAAMPPTIDDGPSAVAARTAQPIEAAIDPVPVPAEKPSLVAEAPRKAVETMRRVGGYAILKTRTGTARVIAWAGDRFQGLARDLEAQGYRISPGCLSGGHMRHSLHHTGRACDFFGQYARDRTRYKQPPPSTQIALAAKRNLVSGCMWRDRDCGHFEVPAEGSVRAYMVRRGYDGSGHGHARVHRGHGKRYASR